MESKTREFANSWINGVIGGEKFFPRRSEGIRLGQTYGVKVHVHRAIAILTRSWRAPYLARRLPAVELRSPSNQREGLDFPATFTSSLLRARVTAKVEVSSGTEPGVRSRIAGGRRIVGGTRGDRSGSRIKGQFHPTFGRITRKLINDRVSARARSRPIPCATLFLPFPAFTRTRARLECFKKRRTFDDILDNLVIRRSH